MADDGRDEDIQRVIDRDAELRTVQRATEIEAELGRSPTIKHLLAMAEQEQKEAQILLETADAEDAKAIRALQNQAWRAGSIGAWIVAAIEAGKEAARQIQEQEED